MPKEIYTNKIIVEFELDNPADEAAYRLYKQQDEMKEILSYVYFELQEDILNETGNYNNLNNLKNRLAEKAKDFNLNLLK